MFSKPLQLACTVLAFSIFHSVNAQAVSTATQNGIVSAAGGPETTQSVSYLIEGVPISSLTSAPTLATSTQTSASDSSPLSGEGSKLASDNQHGLTVPAILGITLAVVLAIVSIIIAVLIIHRRRKQAAARAKRKSIMDMEFAVEPKTELKRTDTTKTINATIGYFDVAKPLPALVKEVEPDRLSRSSTIIGDAAEVAQINRKASSHQRKERATREQVRERNHALQILITNEDNRTSVLPSSPAMSDPSTPVNAESNPQANCPDGDGDPFAKRPSKI